MDDTDDLRRAFLGLEKDRRARAPSGPSGPSETRRRRIERAQRRLRRAYSPLRILMLVVMSPVVAMGMATGVTGPAIAAYAVEISDPEHHGPAMGALRFAGDLGYLVGPISFGFVIDATGIGQSVEGSGSSRATRTTVVAGTCPGAPGFSCPARVGLRRLGVLLV
jgi:MFS family permease